ncbi:MAG TPA: hypothetical protein VNB94_07950 [Mycobacteriales bacterium]|nr:hypothetical protein [Mycobacteriales bacterium]
MRYQVGTQLELTLPSTAATEAAFERWVRELVGVGVPEAMWAGRPGAGRVEIMLVLDGDDAEHALSIAMNALRATSRDMGRALPRWRLRSLAAQPLGNPEDWPDHDY